MNPLVIGIGNRWRRDDGLGPRAVEALETRLPDGIDHLVLDGEPARLVDAWTGRNTVVVIDAVRDGNRPGTIHCFDALTLEQPIERSASSHGAGLQSAVALGRALGRLPERLTVLGIEPADMDHGTGLSDPVADAFEPLIERVVQEMRSTRGEPRGSQVGSLGPTASGELLRLPSSGHDASTKGTRITMSTTNEPGSLALHLGHLAADADALAALLGREHEESGDIHPEALGRSQRLSTSLREIIRALSEHEHLAIGADDVWTALTVKHQDHGSGTVS